MAPVPNPALYVLEADKGDSFILAWEFEGRQEAILIDCGIERTYRKIYPLVERFERLTAVIITHIDYDHLGGFFSFLEDENPPCKLDFPVYINTPEYALMHSGSEKVNWSHGIEMEQLLKQKGIHIKGMFAENGLSTRIEFPGMTVSVLSPTEEILKEFKEKWNAVRIKQLYEEEQALLEEKTSRGQKDKPIEDFFMADEVFPEIKDDLINASSTAFIIECGPKKFLMLGDSNPNVIEAVLRKSGFSENNKLEVDYVKVAHHGSKHNTSKSLLNLIECNAFILSTNGSGPYYHPDKHTIAKLIEHTLNNNTSLHLICNYDLDDQILTKAEQEKYRVILEVKNQLSFHV